MVDVVERSWQHYLTSLRGCATAENGIECAILALTGLVAKCTEEYRLAEVAWLALP
jgi:hypothetical protein